MSIKAKDKVKEPLNAVYTIKGDETSELKDKLIAALETIVTLQRIIIKNLGE